MSWSALGWRLASWDTPFWNSPNRRAGRYNRAGSPPTQYVALHPWAPWAELLRWEDRRTAGDAGELRGRLWAVRVTLEAEPTPLGFAEAAAHGADPADLVAEDYAVCQDLADEARATGEPALLVPSAALPGTSTIVVFGARVLVPWHLAPVDPDIDVPAAVCADRACPPSALLAHVRWRGTPHAALDQWQAGTTMTFEEPVPTPLA